MVLPEPDWDELCSAVSKCEHRATFNLKRSHLDEREWLDDGAFGIDARRGGGAKYEASKCVIALGF